MRGLPRRIGSYLARDEAPKLWGWSARRIPQGQLALGIFLEFGEDKLGDFFQGVEDALALDGNGFESGFTLDGELLFQSVDGHGVRQVPFIELEDVGDGGEVEVVILEVLAEVIEGFEVGIEALFLRVSNEYDAVGAF